MAKVDLMNLQPQKISRDLRGKFLLLYGNAKSGKTTLASQIENSLIVSFEPGTNALDDVLVQTIDKWEDWKKVVRQLIKNKEVLQEHMSVIVIDTVDEAYKSCEKYICQQENVTQLKEIPYGKSIAA